MEEKSIQEAAAGEEVMDDESKKRRRGDDDEDDIHRYLIPESDEYEDGFASQDDDHHMIFQTQTPGIDTDSKDSDDEPDTFIDLQKIDYSKPVIGMKLTKSQAYRSLVEFRVWRAAGGGRVVAPEPELKPDNVVGSSSHQPHPHQRPMSMTEKFKASNFEFTSISIGEWKRVSRRDGELIAKLYFAKKLLVWEFLDGKLKSKIQVRWSDITAINAIMPPNQPGTLQIELGNPPSFYGESTPLPMKHTSWIQVSDFTDGHAASLNRRHCASFPPRVLNSHMEKLLQCDPYLFELSRKPFPSSESSLFFNTTVNPVMPMQVQFNNMPQLPSNFSIGGGVDHEQSTHLQPQLHEYSNPNHLYQSYNPTPPPRHEQAFLPPLPNHMQQSYNIPTPMSSFKQASPHLPPPRLEQTFTPPSLEYHMQQVYNPTPISILEASHLQDQQAFSTPPFPLHGSAAAHVDPMKTVVTEVNFQHMVENRDALVLGDQTDQSCYPDPSVDNEVCIDYLVDSFFSVDITNPPIQTNAPPPPPPTNL